MGQDILFLPYGFYLFLFIFLSSRNLSGRRVDICHTCTHGLTVNQWHLINVISCCF